MRSVMRFGICFSALSLLIGFSNGRANADVPERSEAIKCRLDGKDEFSKYLMSRTKCFNDHLTGFWRGIVEKRASKQTNPLVIDYSCHVSGGFTDVRLIQSSGDAEIDELALIAVNDLGDLEPTEIGDNVLFSFESRFEGDRVKTIFLGVEPRTVYNWYPSSDLPLQTLSAGPRTTVDSKFVRRYKSNQ
jgi:hypothetical protein